MKRFSIFHVILNHHVREMTDLTGKAGVSGVCRGTGDMLEQWAALFPALGVGYISSNNQKHYEAVIEECTVGYGAHLPTLAKLLEEGHFAWISRMAVISNHRTNC